ncbi:MAG: hypothetical protein ACM3WS_07355 [Bacillota bacterium]
MQPLRILIHAPTAGAVVRARNNAANLRKELPDAEVRIVVNADGVREVLDVPRPDTDRFTLVCGNTLNKIQRIASSPLQVVPGAALAIALMQREGWRYIVHEDGARKDSGGG